MRAGCLSLAGQLPAWCSVEPSEWRKRPVLSVLVVPVLVVSVQVVPVLVVSVQAVPVLVVSVQVVPVLVVSVQVVLVQAGRLQGRWRGHLVGGVKLLRFVWR